MPSLNYRILLAFSILAVLFLACAITPSPEPTQDMQPQVDVLTTIEALEGETQTYEATQASAPLPFEGFWISESDDLTQSGQLLAITEDSFYQLQTYDPVAPNLPVSAREMFAEIVSYDLASNHMVLRIKWFRTNGQFGGFDHPTATVTYDVDGDILRIGILRRDDTQFPEAPNPEPYYRK